MKNKKDTLTFIKNIDILTYITSKYPHQEKIYYIIYSPFIYNKLEGCKETKDLFFKILLKKLKLSQKDYCFYMKESMRDTTPDLHYFIKINKVFPEYKNHFIWWINLMYYSHINLRYMLSTKSTHEIFQHNSSIIHSNYLDIKNIVAPLYLLFEEGKKIIKKIPKKVSSIENNNLLLMLLSDYKDILMNIREKDYLFKKTKIEHNVSYIEKQTQISREILFSLDYKKLITKNHARFHMK